MGNIVANSNFINTILVFDGDELLLTTDPKVKKIEKDIILDDLKTFNEKLKNISNLKEEIILYEQNRQKKLALVYVLDKDYIKSYFIKNRDEFFVYFGILPIIGFLSLFFIFRKYITIPLEKLRKLAHYNTNIPKAFKIKELESIRYSMVDSFTKLEKEKKDLFLMARTDSLSGLANRNYLNEFLEILIPTAKRKK